MKCAMKRTKLCSFRTKFRNQKIKQHANVLLETTTFKTMLNSAVKCRKLLNSPIFSGSAYYPCTSIFHY